MVQAEEERPALGWANFALKADYVVFTSSFWKDNDLENAPLIVWKATARFTEICIWAVKSALARAAAPC